MMMVTSALRDKALKKAMRLSSAENPYVTLSSLEEDETDLKFERLGLISPGGAASVSPQSTSRNGAIKKGFSDTDSGISNTASSSCESFQSDHYLPDPARDVLYDNFNLVPTSEYDPEEENVDDDDFELKLSLSLANLGIGVSSNNNVSHNQSMPNEEDYYENVGWVDYSNLNIDLDEIGVDFDIVEPPPAFAESNSDNEIRQLVVDSEADEFVEDAGENCDDNEDETTERAVNEDFNDDGIDESLEDLGGVLRDLIAQCNSSPLLFQNPSANNTSHHHHYHHSSVYSANSSFHDSSNKPADDGTGSGFVEPKLSKSDSVPGNPGTSRSGSGGGRGNRGTGNSNKNKSHASSSTPSSANGKKKRKRERYEIRLGYPCYNLELDDKDVFIYSLQKNKDMMEDLLGHSKLKNSKYNISSFNSLCMFT